MIPTHARNIVFVFLCKHFHIITGFVLLMKMCDLCTLLFLVPNYVQLCRLLSDKRPATPGNEWYGAASVVVVLEGRRVGRKIGCK